MQHTSTFDGYSEEQEKAIYQALKEAGLKADADWDRILFEISTTDLTPGTRPVFQLVMRIPVAVQSSQESVAGSPTHCEARPDYTYTASVQ